MTTTRMKSLWQVDAAGLAICAACAGAWYMLGVAPLSEARATRETLVEEREFRRARLAETDGKKKLHEERLAALQEQIQAERTPLEPADHINSRLKSVTELAARCRLRIDEIRPGSAAVLEHYTGVAIRVSGEGSYAAVTMFLHEVKTRYRDLGVTGFDLRGEPQAIDKPALFTVDLLWYAQPPISK